MLEFPPRLSRQRIDGANDALFFFLGQREERAADERPSGTVRRLEVVVGHEGIALVLGECVEEMRSRTV